MALVTSSSRRPLVSKVLLSCLILCGVHVFLERKAKANLTLCVSRGCAHGLNKLLAFVFRIRSTIEAAPRNKGFSSDTGRRIDFSSLPQNFASPGQSTGPTRERIGPLPAPSPQQPTTSNTQQLEQPPNDPSTGYPGLFRAPKPFLGILPVTVAQLIPRRWPTSRTDPVEPPNMYTRPMMIPENAAQGYIPPHIVSFIPDRIRPGWTRFLHPQGPVYYFNQEKRIVTNANIFDDQCFEVLRNVGDQLYQQLARDPVRTPSDTQLVLDIRWDEMMIGYYFATLEGRCLFWLQEKFMRRLFKRVERVSSYSHLSHLMEAEFWLHYQYFPHIQIFTPQIVREMKGFLLFTATDQMFNTKTASEYSTEEVEKGLGIVNSIPFELIRSVSVEAARIQHGDGYYMWIAGSIMATNALHRFDNYHGQPNARWNRDDLLFNDSGQRARTPLISFLSPILFYAPETYYQSLSHVFNENSVFFEAWRTFVRELHQEWNDLTIIATVLLATNVAFLAIPSLDNGNEPDKRSPAQICSYLSTVWSMSSIVLGQLFSRYHRIKGWEHFDERITENFNFLSDIGCSQLAIMYSLPYALLSWSLVAFLVAFLIMCFNDTRNVVRLTLGVTSAVITLVMLYCVWRMRANDEERHEDSLPISLWKVLRDVATGRRTRRETHEEPESFDPPIVLDPRAYPEPNVRVNA